MLDTQTPLIAEFLKDHQQFSRLLQEIAKLLGDNKIDSARERARELDALAGSHIAYEESELYPRLARLSDGSVSEDLLVGQHHEVLDALRILVDDKPLDNETLEQVQAGFQLALSHAEHCGSLISLMSRLNERQLSDSLAELKKLRTQGRKWTEL